eukprot:2650243-Alexandrium_andersonii.AAC.1
MSASLVGSEMCIRDRLSTELATAAGDPGAARVPVRPHAVVQGRGGHLAARGRARVHAPHHRPRRVRQEWLRAGLRLDGAAQQRQELHPDVPAAALGRGAGVLRCTAPQRLL